MHCSYRNGFDFQCEMQCRFHLEIPRCISRKSTQLHSTSRFRLRMGGLSWFLEEASWRSDRSIGRTIPESSESHGNRKVGATAVWTLSQYLFCSRTTRRYPESFVGAALRSGPRMLSFFVLSYEPFWGLQWSLKAD